VTASAFAPPPATVYNNGVVFNAPGTSGRDIILGPGSSNMDLSLFKNFSVTEKIKGQFRLQAYNLTNTPHFANPNGNLGNYTTTGCPAGETLCFSPNAQFGLINSVQPYSWRQVELGLRFTF